MLKGIDEKVVLEDVSLQLGRAKGEFDVEPRRGVVYFLANPLGGDHGAVGLCDAEMGEDIGFDESLCWLGLAIENQVFLLGLLDKNFFQVLNREFDRNFK